MLQICRPSPRKGAYRRFRRAIDANRRQSLGADDRTIENDCPTVWHQRKGFLNSEQNPFHVYIKNRLVKLLTDLIERCVFGYTCVCEYDVELSFLGSPREFVNASQIQAVQWDGVFG